jgi:hypothetical protein
MADALPYYCQLDYPIDLKDRMNPLWGPIYALSAVELKAKGEYLYKMLRTDRIQVSNLPAEAPIYLVPNVHSKG